MLNVKWVLNVNSDVKISPTRICLAWEYKQGEILGELCGKQRVLHGAILNQAAS